MPRGVRKALPVTAIKTQTVTSPTTDRQWMVYDIVRAWAASASASGSPPSAKAVDEMYDVANHLVGRILTDE